MVNGNSCTCNADFVNNNGYCYKCHYTCATCSSESMNACLTCANGTSRVFTKNEPNKPEGTCPCDSSLSDNGTPFCFKCHYTCPSCSGPLDTNCVSCNDAVTKRYMPENLKTCPCSNGYYDVTGNTNCSACDRSCATCSGGRDIDCITCTDSYFFYTYSKTVNTDQGNVSTTVTICVADCPDGYYGNIDNRYCTLCDNNCLKCQGNPTYCTAC